MVEIFIQPVDNQFSIGLVEWGYIVYPHSTIKIQPFFSTIKPSTNFA